MRRQGNALEGVEEELIFQVYLSLAVRPSRIRDQSVGIFSWSAHLWRAMPRMNATTRLQ